MVSTRRSGKSTDKSTDKSRDEEPASLRLDEREEQRDGVEGVGRQGGENNDSGDEMPEEVTFATGKQVRWSSNAVQNCRN